MFKSKIDALGHSPALDATTRRSVPPSSAGLPVLSRNDSVKTVEILPLRHEVAVQHRKIKCLRRSRADRAVITT